MQLRQRRMPSELAATAHRPFQREATELLERCHEALALSLSLSLSINMSCSSSASTYSVSSALRFAQ